MPVNSGILPSRAFLYSPFGSLCSATSMGISTKTSMKASGSSSRWAALVAACSSRASWRSFRYGEMKEAMAMVEESAKSLAT